MAYKAFLKRDRVLPKGAPAAIVGLTRQKPKTLTRAQAVVVSEWVDATGAPVTVMCGSDRTGWTGFDEYWH